MKNDKEWWDKAKPLIDEQVLGHYKQFSKEYIIMSIDWVKASCIAHELYIIDYMFQKGWELISVTGRYEKCMYFRKRK